MQRFASVSLATVFLASFATAKVTSPKEFFGFDTCEDYQLANYQQLVAYWKKLASESPRLKMVSIGKTEGGRDQFMLMVSDPANIKNAESIRKTAERISKATEFKDEADFMDTAKTAKAVVWIDGGLHANEVLGAQQLIETAYQLANREDDENKRILKDSMILLVHANPDGMDLVSDWYMRRSDPKTRSLAGIPELYQKYAGHDNNRDFFQMNLAETRNMNKILYRTWFPQIMYNHHQSAPAGTIMFCPPFRNPFNYHVDPLINNATDLVGTHMIHRMTGQNLGGVVSRDGASFNAWWNGGLRTTTYFHNMVGILTETWGSPNPTNVPFIANRQIPSIDLPKPVDVRLWHLKDSLQYEVEANYAIFDYASRYRDRVLFAVYRAARNSIERGSRNNWTRYPSRIEAKGEASLKEPEYLDARAYSINLDAQVDEASTRAFLKLLLDSGIDIYRQGNTYLVPCNQAYRPHILDMFEPQDYPNDFQYPGGPPKPPYDSAGYTPAYTMGVNFNREMGAVTTAGMKKVDQILPTNVIKKDSKTPLLLPFTQNDSFRTANFALSLGIPTEEVKNGFLLNPKPGQMDQLIKALGDQLPVESADLPVGQPKIVQPARIGLVDRYGGSMPSGWTRWLFDNWNYKYTVLFPPDLDKGSLREKFDVIVVPSGLISRGEGRAANNTIDSDPTVPSKYKGRFGSVTDEVTMKALRTFVEAGGKIVAMGTSALGVSERMDLPLSYALVDPKTKKRYSDTEFYVPASVLRVKLLADRLTQDMQPTLDVIFDGSPVFRINEGATNVRPLAVFDSKKPLRSGWAWGQDKLEGGVAMAAVKVGAGEVILYGPEVNFRGQTHASFKLIFNALRMRQQE